MKKVGIDREKHALYEYLTIIVSCSEFKNSFDKDDKEDYGGLMTKEDNTPTNLEKKAEKENIPSDEKAEYIINDPDVISYEVRERLVIERGQRKKKIIFFKKYKDGKVRKEVKYISL